MSVKTDGRAPNRKFAFIEVRSHGRKVQWEAAGKEIYKKRVQAAEAEA